MLRCTETDYPDLPSNINDVMKEDCPFTSGKKLYETHMLFFMPKTCSGEPVTIDSQANPTNGLWKTKQSTMNYSEHAKLWSYSGRFEGKYEGKEDAWIKRSVTEHQWMLMYVGDPSVENGVIPGSRYKTWWEQQSLFNQKNNGTYELPLPLETVTGTMMRYIKTGDKILTWNESGKPNTYTRCNETWSSGGYGSGRRVGVGHFASVSLSVYAHYDGGLQYGYDGLGALRKF